MSWDLGGIASSVSDWADAGLETVLGGLGDAGNWLQQNPGAAQLIGGAMVATGSYYANREQIKAQKELQDREWDHRDLYGGATSGNTTQYGVTDTLATSGPLTGNGLLAGLKKKQEG